TLTGRTFLVLGIWANPVVQSDGKIIIGGDFEQVSDGTNSISCPDACPPDPAGGCLCPGVARLNTDGTLDTSFQPSGFQREGYPVRAIGIQSDGKIIIGGRLIVPFSPHAYRDPLPLVRLNTDGSVDPTYACYELTEFLDFARITSLVVQPDNKVIGVDF